MDTGKILGQTYVARFIDTELSQALSSAGGVVIEGARATGKTMTALNVAKSYIFIDDPESQRLLEIAPRSVLEGATPRLLDEWQLAPQIWNLVRRAIDASSAPGRFILTGSAIPADDITRHTGAGRFVRLRQRTMTWREKHNHPATRVSLTALFSGDHPAPELSSNPELDEVITNILTPGFPAMTALEPEQGAVRLLSYINDVARTDIHRLADVRHEPDLITHLITSLSRSVASDVSYKTLAADLRSIAPAITAETVSHYVDLLKRLFIVEPQKPWAPKLRSRARLRTSPKLHLVDSALAAAALGAGHAQLRSHLDTLGTLFGSAVVHDLTVFASTLGGEVRHYRDSYGNEIDAVILLPDGRWGAVEVKLGGLQVEAGMASLKKVVDQIDTQSAGEPAFKLVITGTGPILTADDGTVTCPLSALGP